MQVVGRLPHLPEGSLDVVHGVRALQGRQDALEPGQPRERRERLLVRDRNIQYPAAILQVSVLGAHSRVVEPRGNAVGGLHLAVAVLQQVAEAPMEHAGTPAPERGRVAPRGQPRSEEHTSELQSQSNLVCRLLLEKKKKEKVPAPATQ